MLVSVKDGLKLVGISIVCCCAVFVCTFMLNFYMDVSPLGGTITDKELSALYDAQTAMAQFTAAITGGALGIVAAVMLIFYIKLYVDGHAEQLGIIKALGYSRKRIALGFWVFGLSVFVGCAVGFGIGWAAMKSVYGRMTIDGIGEIVPKFHAGLLFALVVAPTVLYSALACGYAYRALRITPLRLLRGAVKPVKAKSISSKKDRPFLREMCFATLKSKKALVFFVAFSCFCFSAMVQMGLSMKDLSTATMGYLILAIGLILAAVTAFMAITSLVNTNAKSVAMLKAFGYGKAKRIMAVFGGFIPFVAIGFAVGTIYQYGLLKLMVNIFFDGVAAVPHYEFNVPMFFIALAAFIVCYAAVTAVFAVRLNKISVKKIMTEN